MEKLFLKLRITLPYKDSDGKDQYVFNILNPFGWVILLVTGVGVGVIQLFVSSFNFIGVPIRDGFNYRKQVKISKAVAGQKV